ncbi:transglutaminase TgpA family protein [Haladaptatus sp. CMSO5]|uniref:transglutaminase TgpA family protein n=1 Tax=Haladaptatus sp. CMSO5 TaxID=3120514 RepID=UPI002FCE541B
MSTETPSFVDRTDFGLRDPLRVLSLVAAAILTISYVNVLYEVTTIVGGSTDLLVLVAGTLLVSTLLARYLSSWVALLLAAIMLGGGMWVYLQSIPDGFALLLQTERVLSDVTALMTGLSILRVTKASVWAMAIAPGPVFLSWYFVMQRRYALGALVGAIPLGLFVLTGDADMLLTAMGVTAAAALVGFGELERFGARLGQADLLTVVLATMVVLSLTISVVPGGASNPLFPGHSGGDTIESNLLTADEEVAVLGSISLSPEVRFSVTADRSQYWKVGSYDRYTGGGWVRTGESTLYTSSLAAPEGDSRRLVQTFEIETSRMDTMPSAWKPVSVRGTQSDRTRVTQHEGIQPLGSLREGDRYTVLSRVPQTHPDQLRSAGADYPEYIEDRYLQLPESTPDRVGEFTSQITANAENPYDTARVIEVYLESNKAYSLDVERPDGDIADSFLFEMDRGYCTYYATTMVTMLRTQGIPARLAVGYTPGEQVADDKWVVRGLDAHAWVEVYFPETGWVQFDPTPAGPRENVETQRLTQARAAGEENVDTNETDATTTTETPDTSTNTSSNNTVSGPDDDRLSEILGGDPGSQGTSNTSTPPPGPDGAAPEDGGGGIPIPSREQTAVGLVALVGMAAGAHRTGASKRAYRALWLRWPQSGTPKEDATRAFARLEYLLSRHHGPRRPGETPRQYLARVDADGDARRVGAIYERATYAGRVTREEADEALSLVTDKVRDATPLVRRLGR